MREPTSAATPSIEDGGTNYRDLFLDSWMAAKGANLRTIVRDVLNHLEHADQKHGRRRRARRAVDQRTHNELVETVLANLAYAVVEDLGRSVAVSLAKSTKRTRYDRPIFRLLPRLLDRLAEADCLVLEKSSRVGRLSTISPTPRLIREVITLGVTFGDFGRHPGEEVIVLTRSWRDYSDLGGGGAKYREWIDYQDTEETCRHRTQLRTINDALAEAPLEFVCPCHLRGPLDTEKRLLRRFFSLPTDTPEGHPRFDLNGRLFGGWWQNLESSLRRYIRIDGEAIADLDYASMFPRLAYLAAGHEPPSGDLYAIEGLLDHRDGVKRAMNTLLFAEGSRARLPAEAKAELPGGWTMGRIRAAIVEKHPVLSEVIEQGLGLRLMFMESQILMDLLLRLWGENIVALPMHDGVMVAASQAQAARLMMEVVAEMTVGVRLPAVVKNINAQGCIPTHTAEPR